MTRILLLLLLYRVSAEVQSVKYQMHVSRKSRSNGSPEETGYVYSQVNDHPGTLATFGSDPSTYSIDKGKEAVKPVEIAMMMPNLMSTYTPPHHALPYSSSPEMIKSAVDYEVSKSKSDAKYNWRFLPSKLATDAMYEKMKSLMHYKPSADVTHEMSMYDPMNDYHHNDDDDIRTSSYSSTVWPHYFSYDYEDLKIDDTQKNKDKRFVNLANDVIPVHEYISDIPNKSRPQSATARYNRGATDNPFSGDQPFFSFVLNDYYDKNSEDDPLSFRGLDWGKDFDSEVPTSDLDSVGPRFRRLDNYNHNHHHHHHLPNHHHPSNHHHLSNHYHSDGHHHVPHHHHTYNNGQANTHADDVNLALRDSVTEKGFNEDKSFDKHEKGNNHIKNDKSEYEHGGKNQVGYKDYVDTFVNKYGDENNNRKSKFSLKKNEDKGEKRKGFRRVYHKDEYQEDNEFFDNNDHSANAEESGDSSAHNGGSHAVLQSHAAASLGNEGIAFNNAGNAENNEFDKNHRGKNRYHGYDKQFKRYQDVAKQAAQSNVADY